MASPVRVHGDSSKECIDPTPGLQKAGPLTHILALELDLRKQLGVSQQFLTLFAIEDDLEGWRDKSVSSFMGFPSTIDRTRDLISECLGYLREVLLFFWTPRTLWR
jgi:hypothetical protein